jgi:hypothetical protein
VATDLESGISPVGIYPTPADKFVTIQMTEDGVHLNTTHFIDVTGKIYYVKSTTSGRSKTFDVSSLPAGVYFAAVTQGEKVTLHRVMIVH